MSKPTGIETRHSRECRKSLAASDAAKRAETAGLDAEARAAAVKEARDAARCNCTPTFQANVWSRRDGKRIRKTFETPSAARSWRIDAMAELARGTRLAPTSTTLRQECDLWLAAADRGEVRARGGQPYKPSVLRKYRKDLESRVYDDLGSLRFSDVTADDVQALVERLLVTPVDPGRPDGPKLDPSTVRNVVVALRAVYRRARRRVPVNPTVGLELPAVEGRRDRAASPAEAADLLDALAAWDSTKADVPLWATALYAGLRRGELQALRWQDVDLKAGTIRVERSWDAVAGAVEPKSKAGRRTVPIPTVLRKHLAAHQLAAESTDGLVFGRSPAAPFLPSNVRMRALTAWRKANEQRAEAELEPLQPIGLHECRHTYASLMIAAGVNAKALSTYMGHASITITLDRYGHLMPGNEGEAAKLLDTYLERGTSVRREAL